MPWVWSAREGAPVGARLQSGVSPRVADGFDECCDERRGWPALPGQADLDRWDVGDWDVGDAGVRRGGGDGGGGEADRPAGRDVLELLLEVVDGRAGTGVPAVGSWVDVVEGLPHGQGAALDDHGIVGEVGDGDLGLAGGRVADREDGDAG